MQVFVVTVTATVVAECEEACRDLIGDAIAIDGVVDDSVSISLREVIPED